ncbi:hypothetical protein [Streptomyces blastmyceticus]|uniref:Uncharacterized protein n=1 Tax=Streptomyces blastmyceticus TaxID=68180 RepID=A0ABN0WAT1_9ACTN
MGPHALPGEPYHATDMCSGCGSVAQGIRGPGTLIAALWVPLATVVGVIASW